MITNLGIVLKSENGDKVDSTLEIISVQNETIKLTVTIDNNLFSFSNRSAFLALLGLRRKLESSGFVTCITGARNDVYQKGSQMNVFGSWSGIQYSKGTRNPQIVNLLEQCEINIVQVDIQKENYCFWIESCTSEKVYPKDLPG